MKIWESSAAQKVCSRLTDIISCRIFKQSCFDSELYESSERPELSNDENPALDSSSSSSTFNVGLVELSSISKP